MTYDVHDINAYVIGHSKGVYSLKVEIHDLGVYLYGMTMRESKRDNGWWLQPPRHQKNGKYVGDVEFSHKTTLWESLLHACHDAVNEFRRPNDDL